MPRAPSEWRRTAALAPSPKSTQVLRSFQSVTEESFSEATTRMVLYAFDSINRRPISRP